MGSHLSQVFSKKAKKLTGFRDGFAEQMRIKGNIDLIGSHPQHRQALQKPIKQFLTLILSDIVVQLLENRFGELDLIIDGLGIASLGGIDNLK